MCVCVYVCVCVCERVCARACACACACMYASGRQGRSLVDPPEFLLLLSPVADDGHTRSFKYREVQILGRNLHFQER